MGQQTLEWDRLTKPVRRDSSGGLPYRNWNQEPEQCVFAESVPFRLLS